MDTASFRWDEIAAGALSGGLVTRAIGWMTNRATIRKQVDESVTSAFGLISGRLEKVEGQHEECEDKLAKANKRVDVVETALTAAQAEIERLMNERVPGYAPSDLKRPPSPRGQR